MAVASRRLDVAHQEMWHVAKVSSQLRDVLMGKI